jgi:hypothetical protein
MKKINLSIAERIAKAKGISVATVRKYFLRFKVYDV